MGATPSLPARGLGQQLESQGRWGVGPEHMQPLADLGGRRGGAWGSSLGVTAPALFFQPGFYEQLLSPDKQLFGTDYMLGSEVAAVL